MATNYEVWMNSVTVTIQDNATKRVTHESCRVRCAIYAAREVAREAYTRDLDSASLQVSRSQA